MRFFCRIKESITVIIYCNIFLYGVFRYSLTFFCGFVIDFLRLHFTTKSDKFLYTIPAASSFIFSNYLLIFIKKERTISLDNHCYQIVLYLEINLYKHHQSSRKLLRIKVTPDLHLIYSKNGGNLGLVLKMKNIACPSILLTKHVKYTYLYLFIFIFFFYIQYCSI